MAASCEKDSHSFPAKSLLKSLVSELFFGWQRHLDRRDRQSLNLAFQSDLQHLVHRLDEMELHQVPNILWDIRQVLLVISRQYRLMNAVPVGGQQFFLETPDRQHLAAQSDFTRHRHVTPDGYLRQRAADRSSNRDTSRRPVFGNGALRHVQVHVQVSIEIPRQPELMR